MTTGNKKGKGRETTGAQPLPKYKGKKGGNVGGRGRRAQGPNSVARRALRSIVRSGGSVHSPEENSGTSERRLPPPVFTGLNNAKQTSKGYTERLIGGGIRVRRDGTYKRSVSRNRTGGSPRNSGMSKKQIKNPKR